MALSPKASRPAVKTEQSGRPARRNVPGPFGGMNMRSAQIHREPNQPSQTQVKRSTAGRWPERKERGSSNTFRALKMQRALGKVTYKQRGLVKESIKSIDTFNQFTLLPIIQESIATEALPGLVDITPTPIQRLAIPAFLGTGGKARHKRPTQPGSKEMEQFLIAAETGSGKTLAYLLPVLDAIKRAESADAETEVEVQRQEAAKKEEMEKLNPFALESPALSNRPHPTTGRPRAIILLPTSELVTQVGNLAKKLSHAVKFRSALLSSAYTGRVIRNRLFSPSGIDVLISTPHLLSSIAESDPNILSRVSHLVIDEADSLLDRSFSPITSTILDKASPSLRQLILCSATIPRSLDSFLRRRFPDMRRLVTPNLHAIPRRVQLGVVDVDKEPYRGNKQLACAETIWSIGKAAAEQSGPEDAYPDIRRIIVFVNERETAQQVADYLQSKGIDAAALTRDTPEQRQSALLGTFTSTMSKPGSAPHFPEPSSVPPSVAPVHRRLPNVKVLVTTDLGARGIDTVAVRHVILHDVPHSTIDFIHRLGRTGRMGRRGRGVVLVGRGDRRDVVREVREGMFQGQALI
ncbi:RNA helicase [Loxospora ochrophaea]|nr:RNA helicase [Loxospora ochrophaea]